jgi:hypothetical protein
MPVTRRWRKSRNLTVHISIPGSAKKGGRPPGLDVQVAVIGVDFALVDRDAHPTFLKIFFQNSRTERLDRLSLPRRTPRRA